MPKLNFTPALKRFFPNLKEAQYAGRTVQELLDNMEMEYPGINSYLRDEAGALRQHINIFIDQNLIQDRIHLQDSLETVEEILIFQALSGG